MTMKHEEIDCIRLKGGPKVLVPTSLGVTGLRVTRTGKSVAMREETEDRHGFKLLAAGFRILAFGIAVCH
jgi:hypothetical protein